MAAGDPLLSTDVSRCLFGVLSADLTMQSYAPGGFWDDTPPQIEGDYDLAMEYDVDSRVKNAANGLAYVSLQDHNTGHDPAASPLWWRLCYPVVRWWEQSAGRDVNRQDGRDTRSMSTPKFVVCMLDSQNTGEADFVNGTLGAGKFELGAKWIYKLLHSKQIFVNGYWFAIRGLRPYRQDEKLQQGTLDVMLGYHFDIVAQ